MRTIIFGDLGQMEYAKSWDYQENLLAQLVKNKFQSDEKPADSPKGYLLFVEHPHVFTLGKSGHAENLLVNDEVLHSKGATFYKTNRGGDITYHGPGQIVGYPIIDLDDFNIGVREYIYLLEEAVIQTLNHFGIQAERLTGATGVWLDGAVPGKARKICAIGVRVSRGITMHGFAFNVTTDLSYYNLINPCGFIDKSVTSIENELRKPVDMKGVKQMLLQTISKVFGIQFIEIALPKPVFHPITVRNT